MLPLNSIIKDPFDKFDQDFQAPNLPEGKLKLLLPLLSGTRWDNLVTKTRYKN